ncbi:MAG: carboxy terminal-processing peptidase [Planctomycetota bacterium]
MRNRTIISLSTTSSLVLLSISVLFLHHPIKAQTNNANEEFGYPSAAEKQVSKIVSTLMQKDHLSRRPLNDDISRRAFDIFVRALDPMKIYFMQSDIDTFTKFESQLDDKMKRGDYSIAFAIYKRFLKRVDQRVETAIDLIDNEFDYTVDEEIVTDRDLITHPKTEEEARERWRKRIKYNLLVLSSDNDKDSDPKEKLRKRYKSFSRRMHQTDNSDVVEMFISSVTASFDPHTSYMSSETFENFMIQMRLQLEGIGATLQASEDDGYTVIKRIVPGGAADKHGDLKVEDKIVAVGQGTSGEMVDVTGMKLDDVVKQIRGKAGTTVRLKLLTEKSGIQTIAIVREKIKLEDSAAQGVVFDEGTKADGTPFKVGVIDLPSFYADLENASKRSSDYKSTTRDVDRILGEFREQNVDAVVLDLRRNGGGSLREAIDCTGLFINSGPVVQVKDAYGQIQKYNDDRPGMSWGGPLVVLTSKFSASASEILAGAVQDYGRGIVVGDTTSHGKGTVQSLVNLDQLYFDTENAPNYFGALKITMQQFYRPNGDSTQKRGVLADIVLPSITDKMDVGESDLDFPVEFDRIPEASYREMQFASDELLNKIRKASLQRVTLSDDFKKTQEQINAYVEQKDESSVTLNREKYLAKREKLNSEEEEKNQLEEQINPSSLKIERDFYLDEVLQIAVDYTQALKSKGRNN